MSEKIIEESLKAWGRLDLLVNNASEFHVTEVGKVNQEEWNGLLETNLCAPFFLSQMNFAIANSLYISVKILFCSSTKELSNSNFKRTKLILFFVGVVIYSSSLNVATAGVSEFKGQH